MDQRLKFQTVLETLLGSREVYFQRPSNVQMNYPAIVYSLLSVDEKHANNILYFRKKRYTVTVIDRDPDSEIPDKVAYLPLSTFSRRYVVDGLNHNVYNVYF